MPSTAAAPANSYRLHGLSDARLWIAEPLLGRERPIEDFGAQLADSTCRALTVTGEAGLGKTEICRQLLQNYLHEHQ